MADIPEWLPLESSWAKLGGRWTKLDNGLWDWELPEWLQDACEREGARQGISADDYFWGLLEIGNLLAEVEASGG
jgi:hypothetical protein